VHDSRESCLCHNQLVHCILLLATSWRPYHRISISVAQPVLTIYNPCNWRACSLLSCGLTWHCDVHIGFARWRVIHNRVVELRGGATVQPTLVTNVSSCYELLRRLDNKLIHNDKYFVFDFRSTNSLRTVLRQVWVHVLIAVERRRCNVTPDKLLGIKLW